MSMHVEWIGAGHPFLSVSLALRGKRWDGRESDEWGDDEDSIPCDVGITVAGDDAVVLAGSAAEVRAVLESALGLLDEHDASLAREQGEKPCEGRGDHAWTLTEVGYERTWRTAVHPDGTVTATFDGHGDWSDQGDGDEHLRCDRCSARREPASIDWA